MTNEEYGKLVKEMSPKSSIVKDCIWAFVVGGLICTLGQVLLNLYTKWGLDKINAGTATSMTLVALSALFTGLSLYDNLAKQIDINNNESRWQLLDCHHTVVFCQTRTLVKFLTKVIISTCLIIDSCTTLILTDSLIDLIEQDIVLLLSRHKCLSS